MNAAIVICDKADKCPKGDSVPCRHRHLHEKNAFCEDVWFINIKGNYACSHLGQCNCVPFAFVYKERQLGEKT